MGNFVKIPNLNLKADSCVSNCCKSSNNVSSYYVKCLHCDGKGYIRISKEEYDN